MNSPICSPTNVAASVAAAWATDSPNTTPVSALVYPNSGLHSRAAIELAADARDDEHGGEAEGRRVDEHLRDR